MVYLEAVLKEAMRLLPAARVGMRQATADMTLSGVHIPKGSYVIWSIDAAHALDPTLWQGPDSMPKGASLIPAGDCSGFTFPDVMVASALPGEYV